MDRSNSPPTNPPEADAWQGLIVSVTQLAIGLERAHLPQRMMSLYRRNVIAQARLALDPAADRASLGPEFPETTDAAALIASGATAARLYRNALDVASPLLNWADPMVAETVMAVVVATLDAELFERQWTPEIVPEPPDGKYRHELFDMSTSYVVTQERHLTEIYLETYYPTVRHVVAHIIGSIDGDELVGDELCDFAVWHYNALVAAGHLRWDLDEGLPIAERFQVAYFDDDGSDRRLDDRLYPPFESRIPGWPTREQWEADGSDKIILRPKGDPAWDRPPVV